MNNLEEEFDSLTAPEEKAPEAVPEKAPAKKRKSRIRKAAEPEKAFLTVNKVKYEAMPANKEPETLIRKDDSNVLHVRTWKTVKMPSGHIEIDKGTFKVQVFEEAVVEDWRSKGWTGSGVGFDPFKGHSSKIIHSPEWMV